MTCKTVVFLVSWAMFLSGLLLVNAKIHSSTGLSARTHGMNGSRRISSIFSPRNDNEAFPVSDGFCDAIKTGQGEIATNTECQPIYVDVKLKFFLAVFDANVQEVRSGMDSIAQPGLALYIAGCEDEAIKLVAGEEYTTWSSANTQASLAGGTVTSVKFLPFEEAVGGALLKCSNIVSFS
jgi:hypothetical protein